MSNYLRPKQPGATVFFTVNLALRGSELLTREVVVLREAVRRTKLERPFTIDAWVVMPDHLHAVWTLPESDVDYAVRWAVIKARFSREMPHTARRTSHEARREHGIWQRRYWEHHIRSDQEKTAAIRYCWLNPVKHGFVTDPAAWPYSSYHRDAS